MASQAVSCSVFTANARLHFGPLQFGMSLLFFETRLQSGQQLFFSATGNLFGSHIRWGLLFGIIPAQVVERMRRTVSFLRFLLRWPNSRKSGSQIFCR